MSNVLINGQAYAWSQIKVNVLGKAVNGIKSIEYDEKREMQDNYGSGDRPVSRSYGKMTTESKIELHMVEIEKLQEIAPDGDITRIPPFDIVVSFQPSNGRIVNHTLHNAQFKENGRKAAEGDMEITKEIPLQVSNISYR